jgi:hypothetical protein
MRIRRNKFRYLANKNHAPKAEVTGSNPVGCANYFNWLRDWFEGSCLGCFLMTLVTIGPFVYEFRIAQLSNFDNWNTKAFAGTSQNIREK